MVSNLKIGVRSEESSFLFCARPRMASNLKIGNWELGIGNWEEGFSLTIANKLYLLVESGILGINPTINVRYNQFFLGCSNTNPKS
jgi:hypothetical protein